jgi:hypothetical protein
MRLHVCLHVVCSQVSAGMCKHPNANGMCLKTQCLSRQLGPAPGSHQRPTDSGQRPARVGHGSASYITEGIEDCQIVSVPMQLASTTALNDSTVESSVCSVSQPHVTTTGWADTCCCTSLHHALLLRCKCKVTRMLGKDYS